MSSTELGPSKASRVLDDQRGVVAEPARLVNLAAARPRRRGRRCNLVVDATKNLQLHPSEANRFPSRVARRPLGNASTETFARSALLCGMIPKWELNWMFPNR